RRLAGGRGPGLGLAPGLHDRLRRDLHRRRALHPAPDRQGPRAGGRRSARAGPPARLRARRGLGRGRSQGGQAVSLDLPFSAAGVSALAVLMFVLLDGFDLGIGILFPFAKETHERDVMMDTVAPIWDGNETWLVLGGGGMFAAFPFAYAALLPALYL